MYSILIVDDERYMRTGIAKLLPWDSLGIDYVETADSGSSALRRMEEHMPDIVLTDIEMRNMDGLTLIRQMNRMNPRLRIIVLTGHDNFSYVQECCRMEVQDYLLKPVGIEKLAESIRAQIEEVKRIDEAESRNRMLSRINGMAEQLKVQQTFLEFIKKRIGEEKIRQILRDYGWTKGESFQVAVIAPEQGGDGLSGDIRHELQEISASSACMELVEYNGHGISFRDGSNALVILLFRGSSHFNSRELLEQIRTVLQNEYDTAQRVYLGSVAEQISQIPDSYADAVLLRDSYHRSGVVQIQTEQDRCLLVLNMEPEVRQDLVDNLEDSEQIALIFEDYCLKLESYQLPLSFIRQCCFQLLTGVYYSWSEKHSSAEGPSLTRLMTSIQSSEESGVYEVCRAFLSQLSSGQGKTEDVVSAAKRYIDRHLDEALSVSQMAGHFYLSVAYFSKLFKKTEGVGCNYYIICQRMERARQLLRDNVKISTVAEQVGYRDVNYFSLAFKKYTGVSPAEYRERAQKGVTQ